MASNEDNSQLFKVQIKWNKLWQLWLYETIGALRTAPSIYRISFIHHFQFQLFACYFFPSFIPAAFFVDLIKLTNVVNVRQKAYGKDMTMSTHGRKYIASQLIYKWCAWKFSRWKRNPFSKKKTNLSAWYDFYDISSFSVTKLLWSNIQNESNLYAAAINWYMNSEDINSGKLNGNIGKSIF